MSETRVYVQGRDDEKIFAMVGAWLTSRELQADQGAAVTSEDGDKWLIAVDENGAMGFALIHLSSGSAHIKNIFASRSPMKTKEKLLSACLVAIGPSVPRVYTFARKSDKFWQEDGFKFKPRARGEFGTWELAQ